MPIDQTFISTVSDAVAGRAKKLKARVIVSITTAAPMRGARKIRGDAITLKIENKNMKRRKIMGAIIT